jgi:hypothetical protein
VHSAQLSWVHQRRSSISVTCEHLSHFEVSLVWARISQFSVAQAWDQVWLFAARVALAKLFLSSVLRVWATRCLSSVPATQEHLFLFEACFGQARSSLWMEDQAWEQGWLFVGSLISAQLSLLPTRLESATLCQFLISARLGRLCLFEPGCERVMR